ncbi:rhodanese-like domain-containing protein [Sphingobacterium kitahiroshimense]|uniref:Rhodanese-like domain-containing protein n=1 Tax=Sphingobacterium kitahiroshimense TaxID=470446 RepID=A0ABV0BY03_9SPHI
MRYYYFLFLFMFIYSSQASAQEKVKLWEAKQLLDPEVLAQSIQEEKANDYLILSVGPDALIKGSVDIGPTGDPENIKNLKTYLKGLKHDKKVIIYCGCCPLDKCPNIRPAFSMLHKIGFESARVLNLAQNIKVDWLDKNYPVRD